MLGYQTRLALAAAIVAAASLAATTRHAEAWSSDAIADSGAVAQDPTTGRLFVALPSSNALAVLSPTTRQILRMITVPSLPAGLALDPAHKLVYVASQDAGMITAIDDVSFKVTHIYAVGGHPSGLTVAAKGTALIFTDAATGEVKQMATRSSDRTAEALVSFGPGTPGIVAPKSAGPGQGVTMWARGFAPGEPVEVHWVYWNSTPIGRAIANSAGFVKASFQIPANVAPGSYMLIAYGRNSAVSVSAIVAVTPPPPVRKQPRPKLKAAGLPPVVLRLLAPSITVPNPLPAPAPQKHAPRLATAPRTLRIPIIVLAVAPLFLLIVRLPFALRRRKERKAEKLAKTPKARGRKRTRAVTSKKAA